MKIAQVILAIFMFYIIHFVGKKRRSNMTQYNAGKINGKKSELNDPSLIKNPRNKQPDFNLPRTTLNRLRTGHGRVGHFMHKWGHYS